VEQNRMKLPAMDELLRIIAAVGATLLVVALAVLFFKWVFSWKLKLPEAKIPVAEALAQPTNTPIPATPNQLRSPSAACAGPSFAGG
jgi:hypothetical protein